MNPWSDILFLHPSMLNHAKATPSDFIADLATLEDIICTQELIGQFDADYGLQLSKEERKALGGIGCMEEYDEWVKESWHTLVEQATGNDEPENIVISLTSFLLNRNNKSDFLAFVKRINGLKELDSGIRYDRSMQLYDLLENNLNILTACGNPTMDISEWSNLASFVPPSNVLDRLDELGEGWRLQGFLTPTASPSINLDYFSTTITQMPINPHTNQPWVPEALFEHIRTNINDFVDTDNSEFVPFLGDESLWLSNNPVTTVIEIDIEGPDNGSVICAQFESCCWIFSTVKAPLLPGFDGYHPISGNRQFGYTINQDGSMEIYTKGVDRFLSPNSGPFSNSYYPEKLAGYLLEKAAFAGADSLWESFQEGILNFVTDDPNLEGVATINTPVKNRPAVGEVLKELLKQQDPINYVPCGN